MDVGVGVEVGVGVRAGERWKAQLGAKVAEQCGGERVADELPPSTRAQPTTLMLWLTKHPLISNL